MARRELGSCRGRSMELREHAARKAGEVAGRYQSSWEAVGEGLLPLTHTWVSIMPGMKNWPSASRRTSLGEMPNSASVTAS